jgi:DNA-binding NarL/FixJ family response regulator
MRRIRAVIADDSFRSLAALRALLATWPACEVVGEAATGQGALVLIEARRPDLALLDVRMQVPDGLAVTRVIKTRWPEVKVVLLSIDHTYRDQAEAAGADAFVGKGVAADRLLPMLGALFAPWSA